MFIHFFVVKWIDQSSCMSGRYQNKAYDSSTDFNDKLVNIPYFWGSRRLVKMNH